MERADILNVFKNYTSNYDVNDPKIRLKVEHTYRVAGLSETIANDICSDYSLSKGDIDLAWTIGMLHDIGRFEQVRRYGTFNDSASVDHAEFGADLLFGPNKDERLCMELDRASIIETAIRNHNKYIVEEGLDDNVLMYCNIIRDADKIDILKVNTDFSVEDIYGVSQKELLDSDISDIVLKQALEGRAVDRALKLTPFDTVIGHASMMQELVYPISRQIVKRQGYLQKLLDKKPSRESTRKKLNIIRERLSDMI